MAETRLQRMGSSSTISTISSFDSSTLSSNSIRCEMQSFKTVNSTFDDSVVKEKVEKATINKAIKTKNTTFNVKEAHTPSKNLVLADKPHLTQNHKV